MGGVVGVVVGKWRQLYLNNNKKMRKKKNEKNQTTLRFTEESCDDSV